MEKIHTKSHIAEAQWIRLRNNTIRQDELMQIFEHTGECIWCADRMAESMEYIEASIMPPAYLKEQILICSRKPHVQLVFKAQNISKRWKLILYSLKVTMAVAVSMLMLVITTGLRDVRFQAGNSFMADDMWISDSMENRYDQELENYDFNSAQERHILDWMNQSVNSITDRMNSFSNWLVNGFDI